jgi:hypothetical protein
MHYLNWQVNRFDIKFFQDKKQDLEKVGCTFKMKAYGN